MRRWLILAAVGVLVLLGAWAWTRTGAVIWLQAAIAYCL